MKVMKMVEELLECGLSIMFIVYLFRPLELHILDLINVWPIILYYMNEITLRINIEP